MKPRVLAIGPMRCAIGFLLNRVTAFTPHACGFATADGYPEFVGFYVVRCKLDQSLQLIKKGLQKFAKVALSCTVRWLFIEILVEPPLIPINDWKLGLMEPIDQSRGLRKLENL